MKIDFASISVGSSILFATDDFFAPAEGMIQKSDPKWQELEYTKFGKWMDGWETRRKRTVGHDWCILKLGLTGEITDFDVDTAFFTGNNSPQISIQAASLSEDLNLKRRSEIGTKASDKEMSLAEKIGSDKWEEILPRSRLKPGYPETRHNLFKINNKSRWTHLRINMFPDGGIARLRVYGNVARDWSKVSSSEEHDLVSIRNGGQALSFSNSHYGTPLNLIMPNRGVDMGDGWETARNPNRPPIFKIGLDGLLIIPGKEWCILKLGHKGKITRIEVDTAHFKGNFPESFLLEGSDGDNLQTLKWFPIVKRQKLEADKQHYFIAGDESANKLVGFVRLTMFPDGGISRLRVYGKI